MRLSNSFSRHSSRYHQSSRNVFFRSINFPFQGFLLALTVCCSLAVAEFVRITDTHEIHLLPTSGEQNRGNTKKIDSQRFFQGRSGRSLFDEQPSNEKSYRGEEVGGEQNFRLELLRKIKSIDHMRCFPKILCGLSVDDSGDKSLNKGNFVRNYLELMRNIKAPEEGAEETVRTEDEIERDMLWRFSPHNPNKKHHSSFERISSAASSSVELADSQEYLRGIHSGFQDEHSSSGSMEKTDRRGASVESVEKLDSSSMALRPPISRMSSSKIPGEKKRKKTSNKSLTSKLTSYFTSWLPDMSFKKDGDSVERELDIEDWRRKAKSIKDDHCDYSWSIPHELLVEIPELREFVKHRQGRSDLEPVPDGVNAARDDIHADSAEHDADIYHTAVNIGKRLKDPKQCDYIYNGCPLDYSKILEMLTSIRTVIKKDDDTAEAFSHELGLEVPLSTTSTSTTTTTTTTPTTTTASTTTTKKPLRKKPRPSTKIMHVLPNGEKVEINFRLGGSEESEESTSGQRNSDKKERSDEFSSSEKDNKSTDEVMVVDLDQRSSHSYEERNPDNKMSNRKGISAPDNVVVVRNSHSNKKKIEHLIHRRKNPSDTADGELVQSEELDFDMESLKAKPSIVTASALLSKISPTIKVNGLSMSTPNDEQPLDMSPSYVIINHQPTSMLSGAHSSNPTNKLQAFQLVQNGQKLEADQITEQLKNYIRQHGGLIPKLSLHSSGLITTDTENGSLNLKKNSYTIHHPPSISDIGSLAAALKSHTSFTNPLANLASEPLIELSSHSFNVPLTPSIPESPYAAFSFNNRNGLVPPMVGAVPGRLDALLKPSTTPTTTTTSTTTTTTERIALPGMAETVTFDTEEITDDAVNMLSKDNSIPGWITPSPSTDSESNEKGSDEQTAMLENLNKSYLSKNTRSKYRYKNPKKKKTRVKANSSRVRASAVKRHRNRVKDKESGERIVIKHAGPYNSSPTVYKSPLKGPGPHGGAYPYLPMGPMSPHVFPSYPFWRM